jgi:hypothetical protein
LGNLKFLENIMKKIIAIVAIIASAQASAFWNNDNGYTSTDGRFDGNGYGYGDGYGRGDGSGSADMDTEFSMNFKGRGRGDAKTNWDGNYNGAYNGYTNFDGRGYGYNSPYYYGYGAPVAPVAPAAAPEAK